MTITTEELNKIEEAYQYNSPGGVRFAEYRVQRLLGLLDVGDSIEIADLKIELKSIDEFKKFVKQRYGFGSFNMDELLISWRQEK